MAHEEGHEQSWRSRAQRQSHYLAGDAYGDALGRPVGVALDKHSALLVADDMGTPPGA